MIEQFLRDVAILLGYSFSLSLLGMAIVFRMFGGTVAYFAFIMYFDIELLVTLGILAYTYRFELKGAF